MTGIGLKKIVNFLFFNPLTVEFFFFVVFSGNILKLGSICLLFLERFYCSCFKYWSFSNKVFLKIKSLKKKKKKICLPTHSCDAHRKLFDDPSINLDKNFGQTSYTLLDYWCIMGIILIWIPIQHHYYKA